MAKKFFKVVFVSKKETIIDTLERIAYKKASIRGWKTTFYWGGTKKIEISGHIPESQWKEFILKIKILAEESQSKFNFFTY